MAVGGGVDALSCCLLAVFDLQGGTEDAEGHSRFCGGTGFGDDVDGEISVADQLQGLQHCIGREGVASEVHIRSGLLFQIIVGTLEQLDDCSCAQIAAADADDHQHIRIRLNALGCRLDALELRPVIVHRQIPPAQKVVACAGALPQGVPGRLELGNHALQLVGRKEGIQGCTIYGYHTHASFKEVEN